jgi:hypothetical protein
MIQRLSTTSANQRERRLPFSWTLPNFDDHRAIYATHSTSDLLRAYVIFTACSFDWLIDNHQKVHQFLPLRLFSMLGFYPSVVTGSETV